MTTDAIQTITSTGAGTAIDIPPMQKVNYVAVGDASDYTANVEAKLTKTGNWVAIETGITDSTPSAVDGVIQEIRLNVSDLGTATTIQFEVSGSRK